MYSIGRISRRAIEEARVKVARLINAEPGEIYFTGCGTESDNTIIKGVAHANKKRGRHIITSKVEHPAVLHTCQALENQGFKVTYLDVDTDGMINVDDLRNHITNDTILISIMFANNEIGTIEPIEEISKVARMYNIPFHTDAVQACGNVPIDVKRMGIDALSLSGHKLYAPKGIGALYVKKGVDFEKFMDGGHQERNKRAGTENVAGIVGLGKACELAEQGMDFHIKHLTELRDYFISEVEKRDFNAKLNGSLKNRLPGNANFAFSGVEGENVLLKLDERGICASAGSACTTGFAAPSHVLKAIGLSDELARGSLRITFGEDNIKEDVDYLVNSLEEILQKS